MARTSRKKSTTVEFDAAYYPASEAARMAIDGCPAVSDLRTGLTKALSGTIRRYLSHKPLTRRKKK